MVDDRGAIMMDLLIQVNLERMSKCKNTDNYHRPTTQTGTGHSVCENCDRPIRLMQYGKVIGWVERVHLVVEWP